MKPIEKYFNDEVDFKRVKYDDDVDYKLYPKLIKFLNSIKNKDILSLGCGTGREIKLLVKNNNKVVGVDFAEKVIERAKQTEPNAEYHCAYIERYLDDRTYDYILVLGGVMNYIERKEDSHKLANNFVKMLKKDGKIVFQLSSRKFNYLKIISSLFISVFKADEDYSFGDVYYKKVNDKAEKVYPVKTHLYSDKELKYLFKELKVKIIPETITEAKVSRSKIYVIINPKRHEQANSNKFINPKF